MRPVISLGVALLALSATHADDEADFIKARRLKVFERNRSVVLDEKSSDKDFWAAWNYFHTPITSPGLSPEEAQRFKVFCNGAIAYEKSKAKYRGQLRLDLMCEAVRRVAISRRDLLGMVPESVIKRHVLYLEDPGRRGLSIGFLRTMGPRAKEAIPALEKIRDGEDDNMAIAAFSALKKIRGK